MMPRMRSAHENTQKRILDNSHRVGRQHGSMNHHSQAMAKRIATTMSMMMSACRVAGSLAQAISGISVRKARNSSPLAIARNAQKQDGGHGPTVTVRRWMRGRPHYLGRTMVTAAWNRLRLG